MNKILIDTLNHVLSYLVTGINEFPWDTAWLYKGLKTQIVKEVFLLLLQKSGPLAPLVPTALLQTVS